MKRALVIRADASTRIGTGHVMRCLALAQSWQDSGGRVIFAMGMEAPSLVDRLISEGMEVFRLSAEPGSSDDARKTAYLAHDVDSDWVVVDGYHFGSDYQRAIKRFDLCLLFIDDNGHADHYYADIVLNQNFHAKEALYRNREPYTKLLLGNRYVLLRREFWSWRGWNRETPEVARKVLVTLGGSDPDNVTLEVIRALEQAEVDGLEAVVVVGAVNPRYDELNKLLESSKYNIRLESNVRDLPSLMAWADIAISAGGSTSWELAFMGLPSLVIILAENQLHIAETLSIEKIAMQLGWYEDISIMNIAQSVRQLVTSDKDRADMVQNCQNAVDGKGILRIRVALADGGGV